MKPCSFYKFYLDCIQHFEYIFCHLSYWKINSEQNSTASLYTILLLFYSSYNNKTKQTHQIQKLTILSSRTQKPKVKVTISPDPQAVWCWGVINPFSLLTAVDVTEFVFRPYPSGLCLLPSSDYISSQYFCVIFLIRYVSWHIWPTKKLRISSLENILCLVK